MLTSEHRLERLSTPLTQTLQCARNGKNKRLLFRCLIMPRLKPNNHDLGRLRSVHGGPAPIDDDPPLNREAAVWLLERSIAFGHRRLAVIRLAMAARAGARIEAEAWAYCEHAARCDSSLQAMFDEARRWAAKTGILSRLQ